MNESLVQSLPGRPKAGQDLSLPFASHLDDLRKSLIACAIALTLVSIGVYQYIDPVLRDVARPVGRLYFLSPAEAFMTKLKFSVMIGGILSSPLVFFCLWRFVQRGLFRREKEYLLSLTGVSFLLFLAGAAFSYFLVVPASVSFLMSYGSETLVPFISVTNYLSFVSRIVISFGVVFELPLGIWFLSRTGLVSSDSLCRHRRLAIVLIFLAAALATPTTDVFNQALMAGPLLVLYESGIMVARISERKRRRTWGE